MNKREVYIKHFIELLEEHPNDRMIPISRQELVDILDMLKELSE